MIIIPRSNYIEDINFQFLKLEFFSIWINLNIWIITLDNKYRYNIILKNATSSKSKKHGSNTKPCIPCIMHVS